MTQTDALDLIGIIHIWESSSPPSVSLELPRIGIGDLVMFDGVIYEAEIGGGCASCQIAIAGIGNCNPLAKPFLCVGHSAELSFIRVR